MKAPVAEIEQSTSDCMLHTNDRHFGQQMRSMRLLQDTHVHMVDSIMTRQNEALALSGNGFYNPNLPHMMHYWP